MTPPKTARNARIVRLRDGIVSPGLATLSQLSWTQIADRVSKEFPDDPITRQRAQQIYASETK